MEGLLPAPVKVLNKPDVSATSLATEHIEPKDVTYMASYNWTEDLNPTIIVPGKLHILRHKDNETAEAEWSPGTPPVWKDPTPPFQVTPDSGIRFIDRNAYHLPTSPLLPIFRAVDAMKADNHGAGNTEWAKLDFITDRNNLRSLLRWLNDATRSAAEFRIDAQLAGKKTVLLTRWEKRNHESMSGVTFGNEFKKACTQYIDGHENGAGHHRIIRYVSLGTVFVAG